MEVSLLGAALALQAQRFVSVDGIDGAVGLRSALGSSFAGRPDLERAAARIEVTEALDPYYRAHACADGFVALACLNVVQRLRVCELLDLQDPFVDNPQAHPPAMRSATGARLTSARSRPGSRGSPSARRWTRWRTGASRPARCAASTSCSTTLR